MTVKRVVLVVALLVLAGAARAEITSRPGPFPGWRTYGGSDHGAPVTGTSKPGLFPGTETTDIKRGGVWQHCTTRPSVLKDQIITDCH